MRRIPVLRNRAASRACFLSWAAATCRQAGEVEEGGRRRRLRRGGLDGRMRDCMRMIMMRWLVRRLLCRLDGVGRAGLFFFV